MPPARRLPSGPRRPTTRSFCTAASAWAGIYVLHTRLLEIVYVGQVGGGDQGLFQRLRQHTESASLWNRWQFFSWFGTRKVNPVSKKLQGHADGAPNISGSLPAFLDQLEAILIQCVEPKLNKQGPSWVDALQFDQLDDDRLQLSDLPSIAEKQADIVSKLVALEAAVGRRSRLGGR